MEKLIFLLILTLCFGCAKEENPSAVRSLFFNCYDENEFGALQPNSLDGLPNTCKSCFLEDDFGGDGNGWPMQEGDDVQFDLYQNTYHTFVNEDKAWYLKRELPNTFSKNTIYQIEADFKFVQITSGEPAYLVWGGLDWKFYGLGFTDDGKYLIIENETSGNSSTIVDYVNSTQIKTGDWNNLTIRRFNSTTYFYLNNTLIQSLELGSTWGDEFGFFVPPYSEMQIDNFRFCAWEL